MYAVLTPAQWKKLLLACGYRDLPEAVARTVKAGGAHRELANELGVRVSALEQRLKDVERAQARLDRIRLRSRSAGMYRQRGEHQGVVETDGRKLRCEVCGRWFVSLISHLKAHDMNAAQYRVEFDLPYDTVLIAQELAERKQETGRALSADGTFAGLPPGPELDALRKKSQEQRREAAREYWEAKLAESGWESWREAVDWAEQRGEGWKGIAGRLGVTWQSARNAAFKAGVRSTPPNQRFVDLARDFVAEHGSLDGATGELGTYLTNARAAFRAGRTRNIFAELDALDPAWKVPLAERARQAAADGVQFETHNERRSRDLWAKRLARAGWASWSDAVVWAAENHEGTAGIARRAGTDGTAVYRRLAEWWAGEPDWADKLELHRLSVPGHLETDDRNLSQCHICGLWFVALAAHVLRAHGMDANEYKLAFDLDPKERIERRGPRLHRADDPDYWRPILERQGYRTFEAAVEATVRRGRGAEHLAAELDVTVTRLRRALVAAGVAFPAKVDRMLDIARAEVAAGRNLSAPSNKELKRWIAQVRRSVKAGTPRSFTGDLDSIDPDWRLSEQDRCAQDGVEYVSPSARAAQARWAAGLKRGGFADTAEAVAWLRGIGGGPPALAIMMESPQAQVRSRLAKVGFEWAPAERSGAVFETQLVAATALARRDGDLARAPELLRVWLRERAVLTTDPWVNAVLDRLDEDWRLR